MSINKHQYAIPILTFSRIFPAGIEESKHRALWSWGHAEQCILRGVEYSTGRGSVVDDGGGGGGGKSIQCLFLYLATAVTL